MDEDYLRERNFGKEHIKMITPQDYRVIKNFFNSQELFNLDKVQVIKAAKLLSPIFQNVKLVDMINYISNKGQIIEEEDTTEKTFSRSDVGVEEDEVDRFSRSNKAEAGDIDRESVSGMEVIENKYLVQQVWILEHLINNPNLIAPGENIEDIKKQLNRKEEELKIHNLLLKKFFEIAGNTKDLLAVIHFKHFEEIRKDLAIRINAVQKALPHSFKEVVELFHEFGFEDTRELNMGTCEIMASLLKDSRLQSLMNFTKENFKEVDLAIERKKFLRRIFNHR